MSDRELLQRFALDFMGLDREDPVATMDGRPSTRRRVYLDTTATALMSKVVWSGLDHYLAAANANSHTDAHRAGRDTTLAIEKSRDAIGRLVGYDPNCDVVLFTANGATGATNFVARALYPPEYRVLVKQFEGAPPAELVEQLTSGLEESSRKLVDEMIERPVIVTSCMEHNSNLLPWMEAVGHENVRVVAVNPDDGTLDLKELERVLEEDGSRVSLVAITGLSNVTGITNPVHEIARMAHRVGAKILVDGAQWVPHAPVDMHPGDPAEKIDFLVLSGHKLYAPGSRGALIAELATLSKCRCVSDVGGGMADYVSVGNFHVKDEVTAREEAGTPNIPGSISMGLVAEALMAVGMENLERAEHELTDRLIGRLEAIERVQVYGSTDECVPRAGVVSFSVGEIHHSLVASYLDDFHNIAVRDGCFCAHPYVKELLKVDPVSEARIISELMAGNRTNVPGLVRASLGVYSTADDIEALGSALEELVANIEQIEALYKLTPCGSYVLRDGRTMPRTFDVTDFVDQWRDAAQS